MDQVQLSAQRSRIHIVHFLNTKSIALPSRPSENGEVLYFRTCREIRTDNSQQDQLRNLGLHIKYLCGENRMGAHQEKPHLLSDAIRSYDIYCSKCTKNKFARARCNHLARDSHPRTKLINHLARNPSVTSYSFLTRHMNTQTPPGGDFQPYSGRTRR